jgi:hypothetical protein
MRSLDFSRYALSGVAAAMLAGCGGSQPPIGAPGAMPQTSAIATHAERGKSWMLPEAKGDLVYASGGCGGVCVFTYPGAKLEASISLTFPVGGVCSDSSGNVFVTNNAQVLEYAHGATTPLATLSLPSSSGACGVDPKTGDLAVTCCGGSAGNVAIFANATGTPTLYNAGNGASYLGYDNNGNLFVSGYINDKNALAELPHGSSSFIPITINGKSGGPGQVQWDGSRITLENQRDHISIARLDIAGSAASVVGKTKLKGPKWGAQSWIAGNRVVTPFSSRGGITNNIGIWNYPTSGKIVVNFGDFGQTPNTRILGVTISVAPSR